jgi:hypothetical protein
LEDCLNEEKDLERQLEEEEKLFTGKKTELEELVKTNKMDKKEICMLKDKLTNAEKEIAIKDGEYDKQLASGKQIDNLPTRHAQKLQELESLQNIYVELETKTDELHMKLLQKTQEVHFCLYFC